MFISDMNKINCLIKKKIAIKESLLTKLFRVSHNCWFKDHGILLHQNFNQSWLLSKLSKNSNIYWALCSLLSNFYFIPFLGACVYIQKGRLTEVWGIYPIKKEIKRQLERIKLHFSICHWLWPCPVPVVVQIRGNSPGPGVLTTPLTPDKLEHATTYPTLVQNQSSIIKCML